MAAVANIVLADGQTTPANHTFTPTQVSADLVTYHDKASGIAAGYPRVTLGRRLATKDNANVKTSSRVYLPVLETAATSASGFTPGPTVAYGLAGNVDVTIPDRATAAERADLYAYLKNLVAHAVFGSAVKDMDFPY